MANLIIRPGWWIPERLATPESLYQNYHARRRTRTEDSESRRAFMRKAGSAAAALAGGGFLGCGGPQAEAQPRSSGAPQASDSAARPAPPEPAPGLYPAERSSRFNQLDRPLTAEAVAGTHNNFYEFANGQQGPGFQRTVADLAKGYPFRPWQVEIAGLCEKPQTLSIDEIEKLAPLEERLYRFRCVEAWAMAVPWTGYRLARLLEAVQPKPEARYVRFVSWLDRQLLGVKSAPWYPWPYYEGLRMDEAMNELTLLCTGIYGHALAPQHGAPVRVIVPWKYGYKSAKSIVRIELTETQPRTFWNDLQPTEYGFYSNVNPNVPHPRWSQAFEWMIPDKSDRRPTLLYNGYGDAVASLYNGTEV